jgi:hypothetical protein
VLVAEKAKAWEIHRKKYGMNLPDSDDDNLWKSSGDAVGAVVGCGM